MLPALFPTRTARVRTTACACVLALVAVPATAHAAVAHRVVGTVAHRVVGAVDAVRVPATRSTSFARVHVRGWAAVVDGATVPVTVRVRVDGGTPHLVTPDEARRAPAAARRAGPRPGWSIDLRLASGRHRVCVSLATATAARVTALGCRRVVVAAPIGRQIVDEAARHLGQRYVEGAVGPTTFDCSGLVRYVLEHAGLHPPRVAEAQFRAAVRIPATRARPGDLVFYHDGGGYTYHVAIYVGHGSTIVAANPRQGVIRESIWDPRATFGSFTHR